MNKRYPKNPYYPSPNLYQAQMPPVPPQYWQNAPMPGYQMPIAPPAAPVPGTAASLMGSSFVKGALIGAVAAYILSNEKVQQGVIKASVKSWALLQGSIEEMKERFRDAEAELHAADLDEE